MRFALVRILFSLILGGLLLSAHRWWRKRGLNFPSPIVWTLLGLSAAFTLITTWVVFRQIGFPLYLETMEGTVLQHLQRAVDGKPIYTEPSSEFVPLAYNPLYYLVTVPFTWFLGVNIWTLRLVSLAAMTGIGIVLFLAMRHQTHSSLWGIFAVGLYAGSYHAMEGYLNTAHSDACYILAALLGTYLIHRYPSKTGSTIGLLVLISSFWFKQHGALFAVGGLLYLTWRNGWKASTQYWGLAFTFGFLAYISFGPLLFGSHFHYFTWEVPSRWSEIKMETFIRYGKYLVVFQAILLLSIALNLLQMTNRPPEELNIWILQLIPALLTGFMGALDPESNNNVFIAAQIWILLLGVMSLQELGHRVYEFGKWDGHHYCLLVSFGLVIYNPLPLIPSPHADESFEDLITLLKGLDGTVYAPSLGQLDGDFEFHPAANWVPLDDMVRGPGQDTIDPPLIRDLLKPLFTVEHPVYILENIPLNTFKFFHFLTKHFKLQEDFGDRFKPLRVIPRRFDTRWPRYLYRYSPPQSQFENEIIELRGS